MNTTFLRVRVGEMALLWCDETNEPFVFDPFYPPEKVDPCWRGIRHYAGDAHRYQVPILSLEKPEGCRQWRDDALAILIKLEQDTPYRSMSADGHLVVFVREYETKYVRVPREGKGHFAVRHAGGYLQYGLAWAKEPFPFIETEQVTAPPPWW